MQSIVKGTALGIKLQRGVSTSGTALYVTRNYPCKADAADQNLYDVAQGLVSLQNYVLTDVTRVNTLYLIEE